MREYAFFLKKPRDVIIIFFKKSVEKNLTPNQNKDSKPANKKTKEVSKTAEIETDKKAQTEISAGTCRCESFLFFFSLSATII